ncbi:MAG: hypothetical protein Q9223_003537, partial [Gallowayella weberi]
VPAVAVLLVEEEEAEEKKEVGGVKLMIGEDGVDVKPRVGEDGDGKVGEEVIDVEPRFGEDGDSKVGEEVKPRVGEDGDRKEGEEVMDVKPRVGEDGEGKEGDEVVDVKPRIGGDGDGKEGEEAEVLEDIAEVLEVESVIDGAEDVGESDEVGEEVKAADVAGTPGIEIVKLKDRNRDSEISYLLEDELELLVPKPLLVGDLVEQEQRVRDSLTTGEKSLSAVCRTYLDELLELEDDEVALAELFTNYTVVEMYDTLLPTFVARLVEDAVDSEEVDVDVREEGLEDVDDMEEEEVDVEKEVDDVEEGAVDVEEEVDDVEEEVEVVDVMEELRDEVDEEKGDEIEEVEDDVEEDPGLLHPLRQPAPQ